MSQSALRRGLLIGGPLCLLLVADKAAKLVASTSGDGGSPAGGLWLSSWHKLLLPWLESPLLWVVCLVILIRATLSLAPSGWRRERWAATIVLVYVGAVLAGMGRHEAHPLWPFVLARAAGTAGDLIALWWRDGAVFVLVTALAAWHFSSADRRPAAVRGFVVWSIVALAYLLTAIDAGSFLATGTALSTAELSYGIAAPLDAWDVARDSIPDSVLLPVAVILACAVLCVVAVFLRVRRSRASGAGSVHAGPVARVGLLLWPTLVLAVASPAAPRDSVDPVAANDPLMTLTTFTLDGVARNLWRAVILRGHSSPTALVPTLEASDAPVKATWTARASPLNVVIVLVESARARDTTVYSPALATTPFLAKLAQESLVVDQMYAVIPRTSAAWIAVLAGRYPAARSVTHAWAQRDSVTLNSSLARILRSQGYSTAFFLPTTLHLEDDGAVVQALDFDKVVAKESIPEPPTGLVTPFGWEDRALLPYIARWLDERASDSRPFLLTVMTNVGHLPFDLPRTYSSRHYPAPNKAYERYLNCLHYIDGYLQDLVGSLRDRGLLEKTMIVILGDHGETLGEHGLYARHGIYDEVLQVPMLIRMPQNLGYRGHVGGLRQEIDVLPTVADALGLALQARLPGTSLLSDARGHEALFFAQHLDDTYLAMRVGSLKFIYDFDQDPVAVFDIDQDPHELVDLSKQVGSRRTLQAEIDLLAWRQRVAQTFAWPRAGVRYAVAKR